MNLGLFWTNACSPWTPYLVVNKPYGRIVNEKQQLAKWNFQDFSFLIKLTKLTSKGTSFCISMNVPSRHTVILIHQNLKYLTIFFVAFFPVFILLIYSLFVFDNNRMLACMERDLAMHKGQFPDFHFFILILKVSKFSSLTITG